MEIEKLFVSMALNAAQYTKGLQDAQREGSTFAQRIRQSLGGGLQKAAAIGKAALLGVGATIATVAIAGATQFVGFQNQMNEVFTLMPGITQSAMDDMSDQVLQFSKDFAVLPEQVVPALYQSLSAGVPPDNVFEFLETAQMAAVGGITELETAVDGISSVVNAYGSDVLSAANASDVMFTAVRLGKTDFNQLSSSLFNVIPTAASLGIKFEEVAAGLATLTAQGTPTSVATTQLRQLFVEASKGGTKLDNTIRDLTGQGITNLISEGRTVTDVLQEVRDSVGDEEFRNMFGSVEALNAALGTTGPNVDAMTSNIEDMNNAAGATQAAYDTMNGGIQRSIDRFKAFASTALIQVGDALSPIIDKALQLGEQALPFVESVISGLTAGLDILFGQLSAGQSPMDAIRLAWTTFAVNLGIGRDVIIKVNNAIDNVVGRITEFWALIQPVVSTVVDAVAQFVSWQDVLVGLGLILGGVILNAIIGLVVAMAPIVLVIGLIIGAVALLRNAWENNWGGIQEKVQSVIDFIVPAVQAFLENLQTWWQEHGEGILNFVFNFWELIKGYFQTAVELIRLGFGVFVALFTGDWEGLGTTLGELWNATWTGLVTFLSGFWELLQPVLIGLYESISGWFTGQDWGANGTAVVDAISEAFTAFWETVSPTIEGWFTSIQEWFEGVDWYQLGYDAMVYIIEAFDEFFSETVPKFIAWFRSVVDWFKAQDFKGLGGDIIDGFVEGVKAAASKLLSAVVSVISGAIDAAKGVLQSSSPSRVFMGLGDDTAQGFIEGITSRAEDVKEAVSDIFSFSSTLGSMGSAAAARLKKDVINPAKSHLKELDRQLKDMEKNGDPTAGLMTQQLMHQRAEVAKEIADQEERILQLQKQQQDQQFLQQQFKLLDFIKEQGLNASDILGGIKLGIDADAGLIVDAMTRAMQTAVNAAEGYLGIASPSRLAADRIGRPFTQGIADGIQRAVGFVDSAVGSVLDRAMAPAGATAQLAGAAVSNTSADNRRYETTVQVPPGADPLRALRASRHLDKLGRGAG